MNMNYVNDYLALRECKGLMDGMITYGINSKLISPETSQTMIKLFELIKKDIEKIENGESVKS